MMPPHPVALPHLLLVEDDPVSAEFLRHALEAMPAQVDVARSMAEALARAANARYDLWLIDAHLPDGDGPGLLAALRTRRLRTPALAHTAETGEAIRGRLRDAGFAGVAVKPLQAAELRDHVARVLRIPLDWDDDQALRALGGQAAHVASLRRLFLEELPPLRQQVLDLAGAGDAAGMRAVLHRLQASCAFVGAERLGRAVKVLHAAPLSGDALAEFSEAATLLLEA